MAMTKAEKAEVDKLREELRMALALRFSGHREPQHMAPYEGTAAVGGYQNGWHMNPHRGAAAVAKAWSGLASHGWGHRDDGGGHQRNLSASQNSVSLYASKRDALIALRLHKEREFASFLAQVDAMIENEEDIK